MGRAVGERLDLAGERRPRGGRGHSPRLSVRVARVPRPQDTGLTHRAAGGAAPVRRRHRIPLPVRGIRVRSAGGAGGPETRAGAVAAPGGERDSAGARILDVRVLLSAHASGSRAAR